MNNEHNINRPDPNDKKSKKKETKPIPKTTKTDKGIEIDRDELITSLAYALQAYEDHYVCAWITRFNDDCESVDEYITFEDVQIRSLYLMFAHLEQWLTCKEIKRHKKLCKVHNINLQELLPTDEEIVNWELQSEINPVFDDTIDKVDPDLLNFIRDLCRTLRLTRRILNDNPNKAKKKRKPKDKDNE